MNASSGEEEKGVTVGIPTQPGPETGPGELRGWAARKSVAEDARWAMDTVLSANKIPRLVPYIGLFLGHYFVRIAYEGGIAIRSSNPDVGIPQLATLLGGNRFAEITKRARHLTKMLDNTKKTYADVLSEFAAEMQVHHNVLTGNGVRAVRWLESDLGLFYVDGALVGATVPIAYRLGLNPIDSTAIWGADLDDVTKEWGATLAVLGAAMFDDSDPAATLGLGGIRVRYRDQRVNRYLARRFDRDFPPELKMLLLMVEGDLNTARLILPSTALGHESAEFRARTVTAYHCLSALRRISDEYADASTRGLDGLRTILADASARRLLSSAGEKVRNRSVHYEMNDPAILPDLTRPMNGVVESVCAGRSWEAFNQDIRKVTERVAQHLALWKP